ncbi:DUF4306 domain-containing protein [Halobacillus karajensis]|uniref:Uncharacterized protein n=1 Tax=Halobacillus karajensis TaxID=195088 RepID=A0A024P7F3_9BACI|nr:DUF4306 domain-containing protein [Halobacillus karajensis]CDQ20270.1 hypothetical protein BN982_02593 [Halobacillus karajensis]CDQ25069.1 hypothetical protein BN983_03374 [Halobacillus karajensis]CDQ28570.1 hypothetical protein BN981_02878 [Halobacillus karajensis]
MSKYIKIVLFILMIPVFTYSFFLTAATGSYLQIEEDWRNHIVFTPESAKDQNKFFSQPFHKIYLEFEHLYNGGNCSIGMIAFSLT